MVRYRHLLLLIAVVVFTGLATGHQAVNVSRGVDIHLAAGNITVSMGDDFGFDNVTVYGDAAAFGGRNLSLVHHEAALANATLWDYRMDDEQTGDESLLIGANGIDAAAIDFGAGGALPGRDYKVERDGSRFDTASSGDAGIVSWSSDDWSVAHNFSIIPLESIQNITVQLSGAFDHPRDTAVIDDTQDPATGTYSPGDVDFGYATFELMQQVAGLVPVGTFLQLRYENRSGSYLFAQTQPIGDNLFLLPFTQGTHEAVEDRESLIQGSFLGPGNFLGFPAPNFGYELTKKKTVRVTLGYDTLVLDGFSGRIDPGSHTLVVTNEGAWKDTSNVSISVK